jgi:hypothetical protein
VVDWAPTHFTVVVLLITQGCRQTPSYAGLTPGMPHDAAIQALAGVVGGTPECIPLAHVTQCLATNENMRITDDSAQRVIVVVVRYRIASMEAGRRELERLQGRWGPSSPGRHDQPPDLRHEVWTGQDWEAEFMWQVTAGGRSGRLRSPRLLFLLDLAAPGLKRRDGSASSPNAAVDGCPLPSNKRLAGVARSLR